MSLDELLSEAMNLSPDERLQLADRLFQSVDEVDAAEVRAAWDDEIARRIQDVDLGRVQMIEHDEAMKRMFGRTDSR